MCVALNRLLHSLCILHCLYIAGGFSVRASATYSGDIITVSYEVSAAAMCTCQLDLWSPEPCKNYLYTGVPGHMFNDVPEGNHSVTVTCTSTDGSGPTASSTVSDLQFLSVDLLLETTGTSITVVPIANIGATHRCRLDDGPFVDCKPYCV